MDESAPVEVYCTHNASEARFLKDLLESSAIPAVVVDDLILAAGSQLPYARVCVHQRDRAAADEIVQAWKHPPETDASSWTCPVCGEEIASTFDVCWNCAAARPCRSRLPITIFHRHAFTHLPSVSGSRME